MFDIPTSRKALSVRNDFVATNSRKTGIINAKRLILTIMAIKSLGKLAYHPRLPYQQNKVLEQVCSGSIID